MVVIILLLGSSRFSGRYEPSDFDFEADDERPIQSANSLISNELDKKRQKVDWSKTNAYKEEKKNEYFEGIKYLEHDYIREKENERKTAQNREESR